MPQQTMKAIRLEAAGGAEKLVLREIPRPVPKRSGALVQLRAIGVNFIDVYQRTGLYKMTFPFTPGSEACGVVVATGEEAKLVKPGDRVAYASQIGSYAEYAVVDESRLVPVPEGVDDVSAAAVMLQGMTAHYLVHDTFKMGPNRTALLHAAAGGVGLLLTQMATQLGGRVLGLVSNEAKAELARQAGAAETMLTSLEDFPARVKELTDGQGAHVVYDSVGRATWERSLRSLRPLGYLVLFGNASGPVPPIDPLLLSQAGSLFLTRPTLGHYTADRPALLRRAGEVLKSVADGSLKLRIHKTYSLADAAQAHKDLESRATSGKLVLLP